MKVITVISAVFVVAFVIMNMSGKFDGMRKYVMLALGIMLISQGLSIVREKQKMAAVVIIAGAAFLFIGYIAQVMHLGISV